MSSASSNIYIRAAPWQSCLWTSVAWIKESDQKIQARWLLVLQFWGIELGLGSQVLNKQPCPCHGSEGRRAPNASSLHNLLQTVQEDNTTRKIDKISKSNSSHQLLLCYSFIYSFSLEMYYLRVEVLDLKLYYKQWNNFSLALSVTWTQWVPLWV